MHHTKFYILTYRTEAPKFNQVNRVDTGSGDTESSWMNVKIRDYAIAAWITVITLIYIFYGLSYLSFIQRLNQMILSVFKGIDKFLP